MKKPRVIKKILLLILISIVIYITDISRDCFRRPYSAGLKSAQLTGLRLSEPVNGTNRRLDFDLESAEQQKILSDIIGEINEGKIIKITASNMEFFHPGGSGPIIQLYFKDGTVIGLKSSVTFTMEMDDQGILTRSRIIEDQVTVFASYLKEPVRIMAPRTKQLLDEGLGGLIDLMLSQQNVAAEDNLGIFNNAPQMSFRRTDPGVSFLQYEEHGRILCFYV